MGCNYIDLIRSTSQIQRSGCWVWTGKLDEKGYSVASYFGKKTSGYRLSYEMFVGPIPAGLQIDHLCRNKACVNPEHLEAVTMSVNFLRRQGWLQGSLRLQVEKLLAQIRIRRQYLSS